MSGPTPDDRSRRERGPVAELARLFLGQLAAVIGIAAAIVVLVAVLRPDGNDDISGDISAATPRSPSATPSPSATATPAPSSPPPASTAPATTASVAPPSSSTPEARQLKVDVLNQSAAQGAADRVAQRLQVAGYTIGRIDDFRGNVSTTTVYWLDERDREQAQALSKALGGVRVREGFDTLVDNRLSVVLVDGDW